MLTTQSAVRKDKNAPHDVKLEHRHFAFIAATLESMKPQYRFKAGGNGLRLHPAYTAWTQVVFHFADACAATNPKFDRARFLRACGVGE